MGIKPQVSTVRQVENEHLSDFLCYLTEQTVAITAYSPGTYEDVPVRLADGLNDMILLI